MKKEEETGQPEKIEGQTAGKPVKISIIRVTVAVLACVFMAAAVLTFAYVKAASSWKKCPDFSAMNAGNSLLMKGPFHEVCCKNKWLSLCYLEKHSRIKNPCFSLYRVKMKDNFWGVARKYSIDIDTIVGCNPDLKDMFARKNQLLLLPQEEGVLHQIKPGENIKSIADAYGVGEKEIKDANIAGLMPSPGDMLFIPGARPKELNENLAKIYEKRKMFRSPLSGRYTSLKGIRKDPILQGVTKFHNGVDISAPIGTWVGAAAPGKITEAGWGNGYGKYVKIDHQNGYFTLYGHLSKIYVHSGQTVKAGSLIAKSGNTGRTTGPHLHFSIFNGDQVMNPLDYLW